LHFPQRHIWRIQWQASPRTPLGPGIPVVLYFIICTTRQLKAKEMKSIIKNNHGLRKLICENRIKNLSGLIAFGGE
jgi:hypothetical protein